MKQEWLAKMKNTSYGISIALAFNSSSAPVRKDPSMCIMEASIFFWDEPKKNGFGTVRDESKIFAQRPLKYTALIRIKLVTVSIDPEDFKLN